jgi:hypothetical protein
VRRLAAVLVLSLFCVPSAGAWTWPVKGPVLTPFTFDAAHPYTSGQHRGIDIGSPDGTTVVAPASGTVTFAGTVPASGKTLSVATQDSLSVTLTHLGSLAVAKGALVSEGAALGTIGPSGTPELDVPYVHFGVRTADNDQGYLDPLAFLPPLSPPAPSPPAPPPGAPVDAPAASVATPPSDPAAPPPPVAAPATPPAVEPPAAVSAPPAAPPIDVPAPAPAPVVEQADVAASAAPAPEPVAQPVFDPAAPTPAPVAAEPASAVDSAAAAEVPAIAPAAAEPTPRPIDDDVADALVVSGATTVLDAIRSLPESFGHATSSPRHVVVRALDRRRVRAQSGVPAREARPHVEPVRRHAARPLSPSVAPTSHGRSSHSDVLFALLSAAALAVAALLVRMIRSPFPRSEGASTVPEDPRRTGLAVCERPAPHRPRGGLRRPRGRVRALPPAEGRRRAHGERHGRARNTRDGLRGQERRVPA